jgi:hypothetical protein
MIYMALEMHYEAKVVVPVPGGFQKREICLRDREKVDYY